jgi:hypothetical protein
MLVPQDDPITLFFFGNLSIFNFRNLSTFFMRYNSKQHFHSSLAYFSFSIMKFSVFLFSATMTILLSIAGNSVAMVTEETSYLSALGPDRELGFYFQNCNTFPACGRNEGAYQVCYYGMTIDAEPRTLCWVNTPARNFVANSLRLVRRLRCGGCDSVSI